MLYIVSSDAKQLVLMHQSMRAVKAICYAAGKHATNMRCAELSKQA